MNNKATLKKNILVFCLMLAATILGAAPLRAQQYSIKDRWTVKLDYSKYQPLGFTWQNSDFTPSFQTELNYGIYNYIELGSYFGFGTLKTTGQIETIGDSSTSYSFTKKANALFYGVNTNVHLLPFLIKSEKFRFDLYASGKLGGFYRFSEEGMYPGRGHVLDCGIYLGAAFYLGRYVGVFGEYGIGNYTNHRWGLS